MLIPALAAIAAAWWDFRYFRIPNALALGLLLLFFPVAWLFGFDAAQFWLHLKVGAGAFLLSFLLFLARLWGGGDAKLFPVLCLWLGWPASLSFAIAMVLAGGVISLILLIVRKIPWPEPAKRHPWLRRLLGARRAVPYAAAMAAGVFWTVFIG